MTNPSFFVPLLSESDLEMYEELVLDFLGQNAPEEEDSGMHCIEVPTEQEVLGFACEKLLGLTAPQCRLLIQEVPETQRGSPEHKEILKRLYAPGHLYKATLEERTAAYMIAVINAVITKYNSKIIT
jgi:hypothetical protein